MTEEKWSSSFLDIESFNYGYNHNWESLSQYVLYISRDDFLRNGIKFLSSTTSEKNIVTVTHAAAPSWEDTINGIPLKNQDKINGVLVSAIENVL